MYVNQSNVSWHVKTITLFAMLLRKLCPFIHKFTLYSSYSDITRKHTYMRALLIQYRSVGSVYRSENTFYVIRKDLVDALALSEILYTIDLNLCDFVFDFITFARSIVPAFVLSSAISFHSIAFTRSLLQPKSERVHMMNTNIRMMVMCAMATAINAIF